MKKEKHTEMQTPRSRYGSVPQTLFILMVLLITLFMMVSPVSAGNSYKWKISQGIAEDHPASAALPCWNDQRKPSPERICKTRRYFYDIRCIARDSSGNLCA